MAMIFEIGLPAEDLSRISAFAQPDYEGDIPKLSEMGAKVLDSVTRPQNGLWNCVIGNFEEYQQLGERQYRTPDGNVVAYADALMDDQGKHTGRWGMVVEDYDNPADAYQIGVPL